MKFNKEKMAKCQQCEFHRHCINGMYCLKYKKYVEHANEFRASKRD